ncbi:MAG TPA: TetR/AcrR family transcriptional regulator C-terminal domain-containing protein [Actinomycetota bacterium]|jgi:AcrR family transcriptional regulator|nr:TetR/AcrR family transcriptional regulator C-terminal domain-containing protein [Actinomycetota bacterium]
MTITQEKKDTQREPLSRERILKTALRIVDEEGLEHLSMRRIAGELNATPMALYNHVPNKDALLAGIVGLLLDELDLSQLDPSLPPTALKVGFGEFRKAMLRHPNLLPIMCRKGDFTPDSMRPVELALSLLRAMGFSDEEALQAHWAMTGMTIGHVMWQIMTPLFDGDEAAEQALAGKRMLPISEFPCIHGALPFMEDCDMDAVFEFGMDSLIEGFKTRLAARA